MKNRFFLRFSFAFFVVFSLVGFSSCVEPDTGDKGAHAVKEEESSEGVSLDRPEETVTPVRGVFYDPRTECREGFGLCEMQILPPDEENIILDTLQSEEGKKLIKAYFRIAPNEENNLRIEFLERVPNWEEEFVVDSLTNAYTGINGYTSVQPLPGIYETSRDMGQYGGVVIKMQANEAQ